MKTTFGRLFTLIFSVLLLCLLITGVAFRFLLSNSLEKERQQTMLADADSVAQLAQAYDAAGDLEDNWDFRLGLSLFSEAGEAEAVICDPEGTILICSCRQFTCEHLGKQIDGSLLSAMQSGQAAYSKHLSSAIYQDDRMAAGCPILSAEDDTCIGYAVVSAPMTQLTEYMHQSSLLFLYTALAALVLALVAATFLSRRQVQPISQMADAARRFGRGEMDVRVEESDKNSEEMNDLARAFNTMAESLSSAERRRQEFVANVSHELKTPMTTIGGYVDGMLDGTIPPEKQQHYMQIVSGEVRRLSRLVRNMLDITRLQAQGVEQSRMSRFDLGETMGDVLITFEQKINAKNLQVQVDLPDKPVWVKAERDGITQVLYNLTDNAIKFCPEGGELTMALETDGTKARVAVRNTGPTIDPAELPLLFDRFHKADKSRSDDREGWGLGLYIAKTIVGVYGGDIWATSENGVTEFCFTLPTTR